MLTCERSHGICSISTASVSFCHSIIELNVENVWHRLITRSFGCFLALPVVSGFLQVSFRDILLLAVDVYLVARVASGVARALAFSPVIEYVFVYR